MNNKETVKRINDIFIYVYVHIYAIYTVELNERKHTSRDKTMIHFSVRMSNRINRYCYYYYYCTLLCNDGTCNDAVTRGGHGIRGRHVRMIKIIYTAKVLGFYSVWYM